VAARALWFYASKLLWPARLTFIYPRWAISAMGAWQWLFSLGAVAGVAVLWGGRKRIGRGPLVAVLFFAGTLFPALGFADVYPFRYSFVADHFQYLASVGPIALAAAGLARLPRAIPAVLLLILGILTWQQVGIYRNLETLWRDTVAKNPDSWMAQSSLGAVLLDQGDFEQGLAHARKALELDPENVETENNLGYSLMQLGRMEEALPYFQKALLLDPNGAAAVHYNLGNWYLRRGRPTEAIPYFQKALEIDPTYLPALNDLGNSLLQVGRTEESFAALQRVLSLDPSYTSAHFYMANVLLQMGRIEEAVSELRAVLAEKPRDPDALKNLAWVLATSPRSDLRDGAKAVELAETATRLLKKPDPVVSATLAAAYAETGRFGEAITTAENALDLANQSGNARLAALLDRQISLYRMNEPFRDNR
jgi:tetratricopeptide (TPR) repeat protein